MALSKIEDGAVAGAATADATVPTAPAPAVKGLLLSLPLAAVCIDLAALSLGKCARGVAAALGQRTVPMRPACPRATLIIPTAQSNFLQLHAHTMRHSTGMLGMLVWQDGGLASGGLEAMQGTALSSAATKYFLQS